MACEFTCDGCGKKASGVFTRSGEWVKPYAWYLRSDRDGPQVACSRECVAKIAAKTGKTKTILSI